MAIDRKEDLGSWDPSIKLYLAQISNITHFLKHKVPGHLCLAGKLKVEAVLSVGIWERRCRPEKKAEGCLTPAGGKAAGESTRK